MGGAQRLVVLGTGRGLWNEEARDLVRVRAQRAPPALRMAARAAWSRRWWSQLAVSVPQAVAATALGCPLAPAKSMAPSSYRGPPSGEQA